MPVPNARPTEAVLFEPFWAIRVELTPLEAQLLQTRPLRRLRFVSHGGAGALASGPSHSRLEHVLSVFALVAEMARDQALWRLAALLHDVGHTPFSHSLEGVPGVDHHHWTRATITSPPVSALLAQAGFDSEAILAVTTGEAPSPLRNRDGLLHLDHLDSFVRAGWSRGTLATQPRQLLEGMALAGQHVSFATPVAEHLVDLIVDEARQHLSPTDLGGSALLSQLVARLIGAGEITVDRLSELTDGQLAGQLLSHPLTKDEAEVLWFEPWRISLVPIETLPEGRVGRPDARDVLASKDRLYLPRPMVADVHQQRVNDLLEEASRPVKLRLGSYRVVVREASPKAGA